LLDDVTFDSKTLFYMSLKKLQRFFTLHKLNPIFGGIYLRKVTEHRHTQVAESTASKASFKAMNHVLV
jgi:hypothetical protein